MQQLRMEEIRSSNPSVVAGVCHPNKSQSTTPSYFETWLAVDVSQKKILDFILPGDF